MEVTKKAYLELAGGFSLAGSSVVVGKIIVESLPMYTAIALGLAAAMLVLFPAAMLEGRPTKSSILRAAPLLFFQAAAGIFLFRIFLLNGLKLTLAAQAGIVTSATPAVTALLSSIFLKDRIGSRMRLGIALTVAGLVIVNSRGLGAERGSLDRLLGNCLVLAAVVSESTFNVLSKRLGSALSPLWTSALVAAVAFVLFLPLCIFEGGYRRIPAMEVRQWAAVAYYGVFVTAVAFVLWYRGVSKVPASSAGVFSGFMPVAALALSVILLGEPFTPAIASGAVLTLGGIGMTTRSQTGKNLRLHSARSDS